MPAPARPRLRRFPPSVALFLLLLLATFLYWPGLSGGFLFDDEGNILKNSRLAIGTLDAASLNAAAWSGDAGPLKRPISMLSFALNHYLAGGFVPYGFKLTNLGIHLVNILLVWGLARAILSGFAGRIAARPGTLRARRDFPAWGALVAAAFWGLHPLNLTSVLYVVQRMTSLSALFGLAALALYGLWRTRPARPRSRWRGVVAGPAVALLLAASVFAKESGALFLPLLVFMELTVFQGMKDGAPLRIGRLEYRRLLWGVCAIGILAALWKLPDFARPESFYNRDFTLSERLMTESRALFYYLRLFFAPALSELALYHDDFPVSRGLLTPYTTLPSLLALCLVTAGALRGYAKSPLWWFAWGWFLLSHTMESTVISLELVHEHRNYFATLGFAILVAWLAGSAPPALRRPAFLLLGMALVICAAITRQRAEIWADPAMLAAFEAEAHPQAGRARYQLGIIYSKKARESRNPKLARLAMQEMRKVMKTYAPENSAWFGMLQLASHLGEPVDETTLAELKTRLREKPFYNSNTNLLFHFADCQIENRCKVPHAAATALFDAALGNPRASPRARAMLHAKLASYHIQVNWNLARGEEELQKALELYNSPNIHLLLVDLHTFQGRFPEARRHLEEAVRLDTRGTWYANIARREAALAAAEQSVNPAPRAPAVAGKGGGKVPGKASE
jgi:tetratricopeptide (TPR) repeat protein